MPPPDASTELEPVEPPEPVEPEVLAGTDAGEEEEEPSFLSDPTTILRTLLVVGALLIGIYVLVPKLFDLEDAVAQVGQGEKKWIGAALGFCGAMFFAYVALFRGVVGERVLHLEWRESYEVTLAGLAATRLFSAGGAGGIVLTYWALRKAGMQRKQAACRMTAFLVLQYAVYMLALIIFGVLLRTGAISGDAPVGLTIVPAAIAGVVLTIFLLIALVPGDLVERLNRYEGAGWVGRTARRLARVPETLGAGTRTAIDYVRHPRRGSLAILGAVGFWAANIGILWACFHAYHVHIPLGVVIQGFFVGMVANLLPFAPGGVGAVDAGMIGAFVLFGLPESQCFAAVLAYRVIAFWLPIPPGVIAYFQLRGTIARWEAERASGEAVPAVP